MWVAHVDEGKLKCAVWPRCVVTRGHELYFAALLAAALLLVLFLRQHTYSSLIFRAPFCFMINDLWQCGA